MNRTVTMIEQALNGTPPPMNRMRPIHPGEILREEYLVPLKMSATALAKRLRVPANRVTGIVAGRRDITADTAIRLGRAFGTSPEFWLNLQQSYDLRVAQKNAKGIAGVRPFAHPREGLAAGHD